MVNFGVKMVSRKPGRHLKTFLEPVASFSQSMGPFRAMATPFMPEVTKSYRTLISRITDFPNSFSFFDFLAGTLRGLDPSKKMHIDCPHLQKGGYGGSISHQRLICLGFCGFQEGSFCLSMFAVLRDQTCAVLRDQIPGEPAGRTLGEPAGAGHIH